MGQAKTKSSRQAKQGKRGHAKLTVVEGKKRSNQHEKEKLVLEFRENGRKLARSLLRKWNVQIVAEEIDSVVDLSLVDAAERFDSDKGASFMTFFYYHLRGHLVRFIADAANANNAFLAYAQAIGLEVSQSSDEVEELAQWLVPEIEFNRHTDAESPEALLIQKQRLSLCRDALAKLDSLEQEVLTRSFIGEEALVDIAESLGYSRCHVSRVKKRAVERLKSQIIAASGSEDVIRMQRKSSVDRSRKRRGRRKKIERSETSQKFMRKYA